MVTNTNKHGKFSIKLNSFIIYLIIKIMKKDLFSLGACAFAVLIFLGLLLIFSAVICLVIGG